MDEQKQQSLSPAYVPWRTFMNFINSLRESSLPSQINRSVMGTLSYSAQAQLLAAMRFLNLIDTDGNPQTTLSQLVEADEASQPQIIEKILRNRYAFVFDGLDLMRATPAEADKLFRERRITGSTVVRAIAFFLSAAESAGIPLSPHLKKKKNGSSGVPRRARSIRRKQGPGEGNRDNEPENNKPIVPADFQNQLLEKFPKFDPAWTDDLKAKWFEGFQKLMGMAPPVKKTGGDA
jgi:hypothetical protein